MHKITFCVVSNSINNKLIMIIISCDFNIENTPQCVVNTPQSIKNLLEIDIICLKMF